MTSGPARPARRGLSRLLGTGAALLLLLGLFGCGEKLTLYEQLVRDQANRDFEAAVIHLKEAKPLVGSDTIYDLNEGALQCYASHYNASDASLEKADRLMEEAAQKHPYWVGPDLLANDESLPYRGEDFENAAASLFMAVNHLALRELQPALLQLDRVQEKLRRFNDSYPRRFKNVYRKDAFALFLKALVYEAQGTEEALRNAWTYYLEALEVYRQDYAEEYDENAPELLKQNIISLADHFGTARVEEWRGKLPGVFTTRYYNRKRMGEIYFIHFNGMIPRKADSSIVATMPDGYVMKIAFPKYYVQPREIRQSRVSVSRIGGGGTETAATEAVEPLEKIAEKNLEDRKDRIEVRAIAMATYKYTRDRSKQRAAMAKGGEELGSILMTFKGEELFTFLSEAADTRAWSMLPGEIRMGRVTVDPGVYEIQVKLAGAESQALGEFPLGEVSAEAGEKVFILFRTVR